MLLDSLLAYMLAVLVLFVIPGPAVVIVTTRSLGSGRRAGVATGVGIGVADMCHAAFTVAGLSALLLASASLFTVVKYAGVAYLVYLGVRSLLARAPQTQEDEPSAAPAAAPVAAPTATPGAAPVSAGEAFRQGFVSEILNPKTALFFLSFLPQFVDPAAAWVTGQLLILGAIFVVMSLIYTSALALLAGSVAARLRARSRTSSAWGSRVVGAVFLLVALRVALQE